MFAIGLMSGTSLDGIDAALVEIEDGHYDLISFVMLSYPIELKRKIMECSKISTSNVQKICSLNVELSYEYIKAIEALLKKAKMDIEEISFIAMHGQTVWHNPHHMDGYFSSTLQLGDPSVVSYHFNTLVISNFRSMDIAAGGEGAPLIPFAHYELYKNENINIAIQNIGGIGNVTCIPKGASIDKVYAFDTGPGNMLIDEAMKMLYNRDFDMSGNTATKGKVIKEVLDELLEDDYFKAPYPKSTGREIYSHSFLINVMTKCQKYSKDDEDIIATLSAFTAETMLISYRLFFKDMQKLVLAGGGAHNLFIVNYLKVHLPKVEVIVAKEIDGLEAIGFAMIGYQTINHQPSNLLLATGATENVILGNITYPPRKKVC